MVRSLSGGVLLIRHTQIDVLRQSLIRDFERRSLENLRLSFPEKLAGSSDDDLIAMIRAGMVNAGNYGIMNEADLTRYFEYMVEYGVDFDTASGWAPAILLSSWTTGSEKMNELDNFTTFELDRVSSGHPGEETA